MARVLVTGLANGAVYALFALGIVLVYRASRVLNLAHGEIGAFAVLVAAALVPSFWPLGVVVAMAIAAAGSVAFERIVVARMEDAPRSSVTVATIGVVLLIVGIEIRYPGLLKPIPTPGSALGPRIFGAYPGPTRIASLIVVILVTIALAVLWKRTDFGLASIAASRDRFAARMIGLPVPHLTLTAWGLAGALGALAIAFVAPTLASLAPGTGTFLLVRGVAASVVGGFERPWGALAGGLLVGVVESTTGRLLVESSFRGAPTLAILALVVVVLIARPRGVFAR